MKLLAEDVFKPNDFPIHTYIARDGERLERSLGEALRTPNVMVSLAGPSKSGKTVLVEKVVGQDNLITVSGIEIRSDEDLWTRVLSWMDAASTVTTQTVTNKANQVGGEATGKGSIGVWSAGGKANYQHTSGTSDAKTETRNRDGLATVVRDVGDSPFVILLDDFHYIPPEAQSAVARQLKAASERGVRICVATVPHRSDNVVRSNPELRGRLAQIDTSFWSIGELAQIAMNGFQRLMWTPSQSLAERLAKEACGSPQLMQRVCLDLCFKRSIKEIGHPRELILEENELREILVQSASYADFKTMVTNMHQGPRSRGVDRREHELVDGSVGDVYRVLLLAMASGVPAMDLPYPALIERIHSVCVNETPSSSSIAQACRQIDAMAKRFAPTERIIEWDDTDLGGTLSIVDPYFLFYLRSSRKLEELGRKTSAQSGLEPRLPGLDLEGPA
jgi:hypothetical protein